jgi:ATP-dependent DNA helicase DinG
MGTHSFWQGIDLPGDLLKGVIITRLPFAVPDTPIMEAKFEKLRNDGKNPFVYLQIPEAVLKMRQGAGRLIRSGTDQGIVAILDSRITTKSYGGIFSDSLPECERVFNLKDFTKKYKELI